MKSIPFHSSVRIKLGAGQQIVNKEKEVIGIHVRAKTIKNKVAPPFRECEFEIHFGKGIKEHEQVFDLLRKFGSLTHEGKEIKVHGTGPWKYFDVTDAETGEVLLEKKFYKHSFDEVWETPEYKPYIDELLKACMIRKMESPEEMNIDTESYEEVRAVSMDMNLDGIDELDT
jgi:hypothetical protein